MADFIPMFIALIVAAITDGTPLFFGTMGEILTEKSGNLNLGVEGIMFMGGAVGLAGVFYYVFNFIVAWVMERIEKRLNYYQ